MSGLMRVFDGTCPWCGLSLDVGLAHPPLPMSRRCACGALALACMEYRRVVDAMIGYFGILPRGLDGRLYESQAWLREHRIEARRGGPGTDARTGLPLEWWWFRRALRWESPAEPLGDGARVAWLASHAEKFFGMMHSSSSPRFEFNESRMAFREAVSLAARAGLDAEAHRLRQRLEQLRASYRKLVTP